MDAGTMVGLGGGIVGVLVAIVATIAAVVGSLLAVLVPIVILVIVYKKMAEAKDANKKLLETGTRAQAVVLELSDTGVMINNQPMVNLKLRVQPQDGPPFEVTKQMTASMLILPRIQPGCQLAVAFDPSNKARLAVDLSTNVTTTAYCGYCSATFPSGPTECPKCGAALKSPS